jgi:hypothetical protein
MRKALLVGGLLGLPAVMGVSHEVPKANVDHDPRLRRLQEFFGQRDCPLREAAADFLTAADRNDLDWRLLPSISIIESSGGKDYRKNNVFGWDSCREGFTSVREGIQFVAAQLANSKLYKDKNLDSKLSTYNPLPDYPRRVKAVMHALGSEGLPRIASLN